MLIEFLAVIMAGFGGAGTALILRKLTARRLPAWLVPGCTAAAMLAMVIYLEYSWADRFEAGLPEEMVVVSKNEDRSWYRPWTYAVPLTTRLMVVDNRIRKTNQADPDLVLTGIILQERWALAFGFKSLFDCAGARRADLTEGTKLDDDGIPLTAEWYQLSPQDPVLIAACRGGTHGGPSEES
ncbi:hypothetical protein C882_0744 [Caenispirillum salinarum AK4]|uniref:Uncharacterized protein n=1 Tax=Caenispirillum salinarum AK4 TaxID=1238182 RepID=K9GSK6_9PROT|nr:hypothetical protein [Caenispirillum salinarum]EKV28980.1 hypothetical protein C882_0744 [Caenispirillum salinarum AK4]